MLLDELALDDEDWLLLGMSESGLVPSLAPRTRRVPFFLSKEE